jgi:hypothetical protein
MVDPATPPTMAPLMQPFAYRGEDAARSVKMGTINSNCFIVSLSSFFGDDHRRGAVTKRTSTVELVFRRQGGEMLGHVSFEQSTATSAFTVGVDPAAVIFSFAAAAGSTKVAIARKKPAARSGEGFIFFFPRSHSKTRCGAGRSLV